MKQMEEEEVGVIEFIVGIFYILLWEVYRYFYR